MSHDACPKCGGRKRRKNNQCAICRGYGRKRHLMPSGYIRVYVPGHPMAKRDGYALEHRYVMHEAGVHIPDGHHVHHLNGVKADNRLTNLAVVPASEHHRHHVREAGYVVNQFGTWPLRDAS
jgi:hypothetical protein